MKMAERILTALCPDCNVEIPLGVLPKKGDMVTCSNCWAALVITNLEPVELIWDTVEFDEDDWMEE